MTQGYKDAEGKFHPTGNTSHHLTKEQVEPYRNILVNQNHAKALLKQKKPKEEIKSIYDGKSPDEIKKQLDEMYVEKYYPAIPEIKGLDGKPLPTVYHTIIGAMGSPYLHKQQIGIPKVDNDKWYHTNWDEGLLGIYDKKKDVPLNEQDWKRSGKGSYHQNDSTGLTKGNLWSQKELTDIYNMTVPENQDGSDDYGHPRPFDTPFDEQIQTCRGCGGKRGFRDEGINGYCGSCSKIANHPDKSKPTRLGATHYG